MSRNLCTSYCVKCGRQVRLSDVRGKPLEIRRYGDYAPTFGVRWDCSCGEIYFVILRSRSEFWGRVLLSQADQDFVDIKNANGEVVHSHPNKDKGKYYREYEWQGVTHREDTGVFTLDLSYWHTYNDEKCWDPSQVEEIERTGKPWHLCEDNAEDVEVTWGAPPDAQDAPDE